MEESMKGIRPRLLSIAAALALAAGMLASPFGSAGVRAAGDLTLSGNVVGTAGNLDGIAVQACLTDWMFCSDYAQTDASGAFTVSGLYEGSYFVQFQGNSTYPQGYYVGPGLISDWSLATPVQVAAPGVTLADVQLIPGRAISGSISGTAGHLSEFEVLACTASGAGLCSFGSIDADGNYRVGALPPDSYTLRFADQSGYYVTGLYSGNGLTNQRADAASIDVTEADVTLAPFEVPLGVSITGRVTGDAGQLADIMVDASEDTLMAYRSTYTDADGNFAINGLWPGSYRIHFEDYNNVYISGTYSPDGLVQSDDPHTTVGANGLDLGIVHLDVASSIQGTMTGEAGSTQWVEALVCRSDGFCRSGQSDESGQFSIVGLPAGSYTLGFHDWTGTYKSGYYSESGVVQYPSEATPIVLPPSVSGLNVALEAASAVVVQTPGAPENVVAIAGNAVAEVSWTAPLDDGGAPISGYYVQDPNGWASCYTTTTSCMVDSLINGNSYAFVVYAANVAGLGQPSAPSNLVTVGPSVPSDATRLVVTTSPETVTAGNAVTVTVSALDQDGNLAADYTGTVTVSSSDTAGEAPQVYTFTADDAGRHDFTIHPVTAGPQTISAGDGVLLPGESSVMVNPAAPATLVVAGSQSATAGERQRFTVTAVDGFGNVATNYSGTVRISGTDRALAAPATVTLAGGHGTFKATLKTAGAQWLRLSDSVSGAAGEIMVDVSPAKAARLAVNDAPASTTPGTPLTITVTALDRFGNTATDYRGTVHFASNDKAAVLPVNYTFTAADAGVCTFTVSLKTAGQRSVRVNDTIRHSIGGVVRIHVIRIPRSRD
jgi:hypothetical protein